MRPRESSSSRPLELTVYQVLCNDPGAGRTIILDECRRDMDESIIDRPSLMLDYSHTKQNPSELCDTGQQTCRSSEGEVVLPSKGDGFPLQGLSVGHHHFTIECDVIVEGRDCSHRQLDIRGGLAEPLTCSTLIASGEYKTYVLVQVTTL
jgi:hypothetical protein